MNLCTNNTLQPYFTTSSGTLAAGTTLLQKSTADTFYKKGMTAGINCVYVCIYNCVVSIYFSVVEGSWY